MIYYPPEGGLDDLLVKFPFIWKHEDIFNSKISLLILMIQFSVWQKLMLAMI